MTVFLYSLFVVTLLIGLLVPRIIRWYDAMEQISWEDNHLRVEGFPVPIRNGLSWRIFRWIKNNF